MYSDDLDGTPTLSGITTPSRSSGRTSEVAFYYGTTYPCLKAAEHYRGIVVLQSYHPMVASGQFEQIFPNAQRYLYFNPVKTYGQEAQLTFSLSSAPPIPSAWSASQPGFELGTWLRSQRDLERAKLAEASQLMEISGTCGLFIDDTDHWLVEESRFEPGLALLQQISAIAAGRIILNRGFRFWPKLSHLDAVVLENLGPYDIAGLTAPGHEQDLKWLHRQLSTYLPALDGGGDSGRRPVEAFTLSYRQEPFRPEQLSDQPVMPLYLELRGLLERYVARHLQATKALDRWSDPFNAVG